MASKNLFNPVTYNGIQFRNRIVMAPMTRSRAIGTIPNELMGTYYRQRASAGLIITEGNAPSKNGLGYARTPGIYSAEQIAGWKRITDAVHNEGGKIFTQLMHVGRISHNANMPKGARIVAPSAVKANGEMWTDSQGMQQKGQPEAMTAEDITSTIQEFVSGAVNAIEAGFDGVEVHGANGYLFEQFLNPHTNHRSDAYGGSVENRTRFLVEVTQSIANVIGKQKTGVRISPYSTYNDMSGYEGIAETYDYLTRELSKLDILYLHLVDYAARASEEGLTLVRTIRQNFPNLIILNGGYTLERAEQALANNETDLISFGSAFIANPDLPGRLKHGIALDTADPNTFFTPGLGGYTDYAFAKAETVS